MKSTLLYLGFVLLYIALDAASFIHPLHDLNITPWNPAPALGLVFLLRLGKSARLPLVGTVILSEWLVRGIPHSWWASLICATILGLSYVALGEYLRRQFSASSLLDDRNSLIRWLLPISLGSLLISLLHITNLTLFGLLPGSGWLAGVAQFWVGDGVGFVVTMPLFWWLSSPRSRVLLGLVLRQWESLGYILLSLGTLWLVFYPGSERDFKLFYLLFLPIIWASARQGMAGAILSASLLQIGVVSAVQLLQQSAVTLAELQLVSLVMTLVGFFIGCTVDEQRRTSDELRQSLRLAAAGEMAGALAHELNQPLTALTAYASACEILTTQPHKSAQLRQAIHGMLQESARAGDVLRRLRDFFRTGATKLEIISLASVVERAILPYREKAIRYNIEFEHGAIPALLLLADQLQLEVVLRNLLANAFDAVTAPELPRRHVRISAETLPGARVAITVEDSGAGLSGTDASRLFEAFHSSKSNGLGLGLVISKAIVETHGGTLWGEIADHGIFKLILPVQEVHSHD